MKSRARVFPCLTSAITCALAGALVAGLAAGGAAQGPGADRPLLVTTDYALLLQAWRAGPSGYEKVWEATPRSADRDFAKRRTEAVAPGRDAPPVMADVDGDGATDLVVLDPYGITVYGRSPAYYPFESVGPDVYMNRLVVADVDGDDAPELVTQRGVEKGRAIETWKTGPAGLRRVSEQIFEGASSILVWDDADGDGQAELMTGSDRALVLARSPSGWQTTATVPILGSLGVLRAGDVDGDGRNELVVGGNSGKVSVHTPRRQGGALAYPVLWQSPFLWSDDVTPRQGGRPMALTNAVAIGDVTGDQQAELVVGTSEYGVLPAEGNRPATGRIRVFQFDGQSDLNLLWTSGWLAGTGGAQSVALGDLDTDGVNEVAVNGRQVFSYDRSAKTFRQSGTACPTCLDQVIGFVPDLREPASATRIVPLYWNLPGRQFVEGQPASVAVSLYSPWAEARDVAVTVRSSDSNLAISSGTFRVPSIPAGGTVQAPAFLVTAQPGAASPVLQFEITAAGGYRQSVPARVMVSPPPPDYEPQEVEPRIAAALERARDENRRALIIWGSKADRASQAFLELSRKDRDVSRTLLYEYEIVRVDVGGSRSAAAKYGADVQGGGLPYLTVLDQSGKVLANQATTAFRSSAAATTYEGARLTEFLTKHQAPYLKAETLFTEALSRAKKEQKTLFVWFSAPW